MIELDKESEHASDRHSMSLDVLGVEVANSFLPVESDTQEKLPEQILFATGKVLSLAKKNSTALFEGLDILRIRVVCSCGQGLLFSIV